MTGLGVVVKDGGSLVLRCAATLVRNRAGNLVTQGAGAIPSLYAEGGDVRPESSGDIGDLYAHGADIDMTRSTVARTVTHLHVDPQDPGSITYDPAVVAIGAFVLARPTKLSFLEA